MTFCKAHACGHDQGCLCPPHPCLETEDPYPCNCYRCRFWRGETDEEDAAAEVTPEVTPHHLHQAKKKAQAALDEYNGLVEDYMRQQTDAEVARLLEGE